MQGLEIGFNAGIRRSSSGTKMIGARVFRASGWIAAMTLAARLHLSMFRPH